MGRSAVALVLALESGPRPDGLRDPARCGHRPAARLGLSGGCQAVCVDPVPGARAGASEPREDGAAIGC